MSKTIGQKFYETFLNKKLLCEPLLSEILAWLPHTLKVSVTKFAERDSLSKQFFKNGYFLTINQTTKPIIIGKGVCFDSGGYNIKNGSNGIHNMWYDKTGALLAIAAALDLKAPCQVFLTDNLLDFLPGQVIIEPITKHKVYIKDTDAEGRIGLADCLAQSLLNHKKALTIATLTGAVSVAMGKQTFALVHSNKPAYLAKVVKAKYEKKLKLWPMPSDDVYDQSMKSKIRGADLDNLNDSLGGGGSQKAFAFLKNFFRGDLIHVDIASMVYDSNGNGVEWGLNEMKFLYTLLSRSNG